MMAVDVKVFMVKNETVHRCECILCNVVISSDRIINMVSELWQTRELCTCFNLFYAQSHLGGCKYYYLCFRDENLNT